MEEIKFFKPSEPYGEFSNFYYTPVILLNEIWPTVEHYVQSIKFEDVNLWDRIKVMKAPQDVANLSSKLQHKLRPDWEDVKDAIMLKAVKAKFFQHHRLKKILLETGDATIIQHNPNDNYWADGGDGTGKNKLGLILMHVREQLLEISKDPDLILPPWIMFPNNDRGGMFWNMGWGEDYIMEWSRFVDQFGAEAYRNLFPEPLDWEGTYN
ncbi:NADAR family protein [Mucilaginibacter angelicae]|uniref:NADAR family protein n=1 Tax=Mucilaginibacter angelicae TaxID=869718 RepID=A0ABV6L4B3_9SPHI